MTYGELIQLIITDTNRDDLTDYIQGTAEGVITRLQRLFTYATPTTETVQTDIGVASYLTPTNLVDIKFIRLDNAGIWEMLVGPVPYETLLLMDTNVVPVTSIPSMWATYDSMFRLYQPPDQIYTLELTGDGKVPIPADDGAENFWTQGGAQLVRFETLAQVRLIRLKDPEGAQQAHIAAAEELKMLNRETVLKATRGQIEINW